MKLHPTTSRVSSSTRTRPPSWPDTSLQESPRPGPSARSVESTSRRSPSSWTASSVESRHYNDVKGTSVNVLGWDPDTQEGSFTNNFESLDDGRAFAQSLVDEGADIVMPVAGPVGLGSAALASELGTFSIVGVDVDGFEADSNNASVYLTSVLKRIDNAVYAAADEALNGDFNSDLFIGTLENGGVGMADFHDMADSVSAELQGELEQLEADIISGAVDVSS